MQSIEKEKPKLPLFCTYWMVSPKFFESSKAHFAPKEESLGALVLKTLKILGKQTGNSCICQYAQGSFKALFYISYILSLLRFYL